ncbi:hypothetical protein CVT25_010363 [Psilocybe cyanescens]|uniref:Uncharacterized protein n=1 Tax=Psilocybe cyanescens TaxID=93625 RepID=A0A409XP85_PSICY|nr:hypothetical protein CVT25_010363 [Psilocybe cyanescens]
MADDMDVDVEEPKIVTKSKKEGKDNGKARFEVKKWNAVSLWAWGASSHFVA